MYFRGASTSGVLAGILPLARSRAARARGCLRRRAGTTRTTSPRSPAPRLAPCTSTFRTRTQFLLKLRDGPSATLRPRLPRDRRSEIDAALAREGRVALKNPVLLH